MLRFWSCPGAGEQPFQARTTSFAARPTESPRSPGYTPQDGLWRRISEGLVQNLSHLGAGKFGRQLAAVAQYRSHLAPAQNHPGVFVVAAGFQRSHTGAAMAIEGILEKKRSDAQLPRLELVEDLVGIVGAV